MITFKRNIFNTLHGRLLEPRRFIQVLSGPRQVGKTTLVTQVRKTLPLPTHYASADDPAGRDRTWLIQQWDIARLQARGAAQGSALILDEAQKITGWSEVVKLLWDEDTKAGLPLQVVLLGSAPLLVQTGLTESLAGRFELIPIRHWSFPEMREAFGWTLDQYLFFGGYPGAAPLIADYQRWALYIREAIIEASIGRDILLMSRVDKPALLRRLFQLACDYSGQIVSYQKMVGQLQDAGNTTTLAHYLELLGGAGMVVGLHKYAGQRVRQRASSPKLHVCNTAFLSSTAGATLATAQQDRDWWGRLVESAVGAHVVNSAIGTTTEVYYWRERSHEVDFVLRDGKRLVALEVKSWRSREMLPGVAAFTAAYKPTRTLVVGTGGIPLAEFLSHPVIHWVK